ncbi:MAG TPA: Xaa-Pro peptidase family protein [Actinomycetota bacterium]|nr:Xaa-Pro peptidase family protein [Actinomycetota bacterium]
MTFQGRTAGLQQRIVREEVDGLLVTNLINVRYLTGFTGSSGALLLSPDAAVFFTDGRYIAQSAQEVVGAEIEIYTTQPQYAQQLSERSREMGISRLGREETLTLADAVAYSKRLPEVEFVSANGWVEALRAVKDSTELASMRVAAEMADAGLAYILERVEVGRTESDLALDLEFFMRRNGASDVSFDVIVAAGERSALPHAHPTDKPVEKGGFLLFDLGCVYQGYCSDLTRTVVIGPSEQRHREIYDIVLGAQEAALTTLGPQVVVGEVDSAARTLIADAGYGEAFSHGLGHGVGLEIHEAPTLRRDEEQVLLPGNVVTVEPGIYIEGFGGVRIEDLVIIGESGAEIISKSPKTFTVL